MKLPAAKREHPLLLSFFQVGAIQGLCNCSQSYSPNGELSHGLIFGIGTVS